MLRAPFPRRATIASLTVLTVGSHWRWIASTAAQRVALLADVAAVHRLVRLVVPRCESGPAAQRAGGREPGDVADLGDEGGGQYRADAFDGEQVPVARVDAQPGVQIDLDRGDLIGQHQHQPTLGGKSGA